MNFEQKLAEVEWGRLHYSSSPDRGLDNILCILPWLREACPKVTLHVYYGFFNWESAIKQRNNSSEVKQLEELKKQLEEAKDYVFLHGRVSQIELAKEWRKAWCWMYATQFTETRCITANEAMLSCTPIVCSNVAALETTVGEFGIRILDHPYSREGRQAFIDNIYKLYHNKELWEEWAKKSAEGNKRLSWQENWEDYWKPLFD